MSENLKFEKINIEPEYLFNLTYTFDGLTRFLGQFNRNQEKIIQRLEQLEETQKNLQNQTAKIAEAQTTTNYSMNTLLSPESMKKPFKKELKKKNIR
jgi:septal ring factor EnvC (AmiA/AmiB activator)